MLSEAVAVAGAAALACVVVALGARVFLHLAPTGLSPIRNAVSQYGISDYRLGYRVATVTLVLGAAALAVGVGTAISGRGSASLVALLAIFAAARLVISWFPTDAPGAPRTSHGQAHGVIAVVTFGAITVAAIRFGSVLDRTARWHSLAPASTALGWAMAACILGMILGRRSEAWRDRFDLVERVLYVAIIAWCITFAVACAIRAA